MIWISDLQRETLLLVDSMIQENKTHREIIDKLLEENYEFRVEVKNGYASKTKIELCKRNNEGKIEYSFVDLIKRKNGLAWWETIKLS